MDPVDGEWRADFRLAWGLASFAGAKDLDKFMIPWDEEQREAMRVPQTMQEMKDMMLSYAKKEKKKAERDKEINKRTPIKQHKKK